MKIVFVTPEFITNGNLHDGGLAVYVYKICKALRHLNHEVTIIIPGNIHSNFEYDGLHIVSSKSDSFLLEKFLNLITLRRVARLWRWIFQSHGLNVAVRQFLKDNTDTDIIQYSSYKAVALFASKNTPYVIRLSSLQRFWELSESRKTAFGATLTYWLEEFVLRKSHYLYAPGSYLAEQVSQKLKKGSKVTVLPTPIWQDEIEINSVNFDTFVSEKGTSDYFLYFGTISILKGANILSGIINLLLSKYPDMCFVMIGKSNEIIEGERVIDMITKSVRFENRMRLYYYPSMSRASLVPFIRNSLGVLIPSQMDNFPNTALEAMQEGKVVFASNRASLENLILNGINGYICEYNNPDDFFKKITEYLAFDQITKDKIRQKVLESVGQHKPENAAQKLIDYFSEIVTTHKR